MRHRSRNLPKFRQDPRRRSGKLSETTQQASGAASTESDVCLPLSCQEELPGVPEKAEDGEEVREKAASARVLGSGGFRSCRVAIAGVMQSRPSLRQRAAPGMRGLQ